MHRFTLVTLATLVALSACGGAGTRSGSGAVRARPTGDRQVSLILFRDAALVHERWRVALTGGRGAIEVPLDAGIAIDDLAVLRTEGARLVGLALRSPGPEAGDEVTVAGGTGTLVIAHGSQVAMLGGDQALHVTNARGILEYKSDVRGSAHAAITLEATEGTGGEAWIELAYSTPRISWSAAYALIRDAQGGRATLDGAVAIDNRSGVDFPAAAITVIDNTYAASRTRAASELAKTLLGTAKADAKDAGRDVGVVDVERGQTRLAVATAARALALKEILVFDPVGTKFDAPGTTPQKARNHGLGGKQNTTVLRSFEIQLDEKARSGLPAGPVRLFGRSEHGELAPLGAGRLFDRAQGEAKSATIPVGRSPDVKGKRTRTDFFLDEQGVLDAKGVRTGRMLIEEFTIEVENAGKQPVKVLVREHMYRGENWRMAYSSIPLSDAENKEGPQQIVMRIEVPAGGKERLVYRVMYYW
jgi:hypothetical protein